jgi:hypothetical protein
MSRASMEKSAAAAQGPPSGMFARARWRVQ